MTERLNLVCAIMQTIIAILGVILTYFEIQRNKKEKIRINKLKEIEKNLIESVQKMKLDDDIKDVLKNIEDAENNFNIEVIRDYDEKAFHFVSKFNEYKETLIPIYKQLLVDETNFSLSYGFERYINAFREFISVETEKVSVTIDEFRNINSEYKKASNQQIVNAILGHTRNICGIMNDNQSFNEIDCLNEYAKMHGYDTNSEDFKYISAYFKEYYNSKQATLKLIESCKTLLPFIEELKYKYENTMDTDTRNPSC